jgi:hypothetical protein
MFTQTTFQTPPPPMAWPWQPALFPGMAAPELGMLYCSGEISDLIGERELRLIGKALIAQAFKDAAGWGGGMYRQDAISWLTSGEAAAWAAALGLRIRQPDINAWIKAGCPLGEKDRVLKNA